MLALFPVGGERSKFGSRGAQQLLTAENLWTEVSERLRSALNESTYRTWFSETSGLDLSSESFTLRVPNDFTREWIEGHFLGLIDAAVRDATGDERRIELVIRKQESGKQPPREPESSPRVEGLNPKYTFDSFVIGSSNRFAHAAALAVAEAPAQAYNPLFIYGGTGLGKTHLLQAIGALHRRAPARPVRLLRHERAVHERLHQLAPRQADRRASSSATATFDVLLIDDIQFLEHKERIQEEFFHTFNTLYEARQADRDLLRPASAADRDARSSGCARASSGA